MLRTKEMKPNEHIPACLQRMKETHTCMWSFRPAHRHADIHVRRLNFLVGRNDTTFSFRLAVRKKNLSPNRPSFQLAFLLSFLLFYPFLSHFHLLLPFFTRHFFSYRSTSSFSFLALAPGCYARDMQRAFHGARGNNRCPNTDPVSTRNPRIRRKRNAFPKTLQVQKPVRCGGSSRHVFSSDRLL